MVTNNTVTPVTPILRRKACLKVDHNAYVIRNSQRTNGIQKSENEHRKDAVKHVPTVIRFTDGDFFDGTCSVASSLADTWAPPPSPSPPSLLPVANTTTTTIDTPNTMPSSILPSSQLLLLSKDVSASTLYLQQLLGDGPTRFVNSRTSTSNKKKNSNRNETDVGPVDETYIQTKLSPHNRHALQTLQQEWKLYCMYQQRRRKLRGNVTAIADGALPVEWYLRYLHHTQDERNGQFDTVKALKYMTRTLSRKKHRRYLTLGVMDLELQLTSQTLFPIPQLKTKRQEQVEVGKEGLPVFYMRPARYFPRLTPTRDIIDNLVYVMDTMLQGNIHAQKYGIGFLACMDDWKMQNFSVDYCFQFMKTLQGYHIPVKVEMFLIVNPPSWFGAIWKIMKPMLKPSFRRKVKICNQEHLTQYLQNDFYKYLPDDMTCGQADTQAMVDDFITYRRYVEQQQQERQQHHHTHRPTRELVEEFEKENSEEDDDDGSITPSFLEGCEIPDNKTMEKGGCDDAADEEASVHVDIYADIDEWKRTMDCEIDEYLRKSGW